MADRPPSPQTRSAADASRDAELAMVAADYPRWQVWAANGHMYGTRRDRQLTTEEWRAGLAATVHAATVEGLRDALANQAQLSAEIEDRYPWPMAVEMGDEIR